MRRCEDTSRVPLLRPGGASSPTFHICFGDVSSSPVGLGPKFKNSHFPFCDSMLPQTALNCEHEARAFYSPLYETQRHVECIHYCAAGPSPGLLYLGCHNRCPLSVRRKLSWFHHTHTTLAIPRPNSKPEPGPG